MSIQRPTLRSELRIALRFGGVALIAMAAAARRAVSERR